MRLNIILSVLLVPFIGFCEIYQGGDVLNGLIAWWKMDEQFWNGTTGEVKDYCGSFSGTAVGGAITEIGKIQRAASLDGIDDYINIGTSIDNTISTLSNATFTCWIKKSKRGTDNRGIIGLGLTNARQAWIFVGFNSKDSVAASFHNSSGSIKSVSIEGGSPVGKWMFISVVISDTLLSVYTNSLFAGSTSREGYLNAGSDNNYIGRINDFSNFEGLIDDVRIYNRALSSNELSQIYNYTKDGIKTRSTIYVSGINTNYIAKAIYQGEKLVHNPENRDYLRYSGIIYSPERDFTYTISSSKATITGYKGRGGQVNIPPTLGGYPVTAIGSWSFQNIKTVTGITFPSTITLIDYYAFSGCSGLTGNLVLPSSLTEIGEYTFNSCSGLTGDLVLPPNITTIGEYTFQNCSGLTGSLVIPSNITTIGYAAFENCSGLTGNLTLPSSLTSIGVLAFRGCSGFTKIYMNQLSPPTIAEATFGDISATLYYRSDATGFTNPWGGRPTEVWTSYPDPMP